jgi:tetratricopeptide (TPR) repeat protein
MFIKLLPFFLLLCMQYTAIAQDTQDYQKKEKAADSLAELNDFAKSEAMYLKALKVFDKNPLLHTKLASLYLKMQKTEEAKKFMKSAIVKGADMEMFLLDTSIKNYLAVNEEEAAEYVSLSKQYKLLTQSEDKSKWIDDFRVFFKGNGYR